MTEQSDFDRDLVGRNLSAARRRVEQGLQELAKDSNGDQLQGVYYGIFDDALGAAGGAKALDEPQADIQELLAVAARAALELYRLRGTLEGRVTHLPENEDETFIDYSATNPLTFVQGLYASLASGETEVLDRLATVPRHFNQSDQVEVSPVLVQYSLALSQVVKGETQSAEGKLKKLISERGRSKDPEIRYWIAQAVSLERIVQGNTPEFHLALERLAEIIEDTYAGPIKRNDPDRFLALPVRGLSALAQRLGLGGREAT
jgi:hypothetical protein